VASKKPWRTVIVPEETGRFTHEQIKAAITKVKEERERKAAAKAGKSPKQGEGRAENGGRMTSKKPWRTLVSVGDSAGRFTREQVDAVVLKVKEERERKAAARAGKSAGQHEGKAKRGGRMATKKPWRTLVIDEREIVGRFTRTQIREVVLAVKAESERKAAAKAARVRKASGQSGASKQTKAPANQSGKTPKAAA